MFTLTLAGLLLEVIEGAAAMSTDDRGLVFEVVAGATGWKHRHTLLEFRTVSSLEHARFSLKVHGSVPTVALPTKWAAEGDEEASSLIFSSKSYSMVGWWKFSSVILVCQNVTFSSSREKTSDGITGMFGIFIQHRRIWLNIVPDLLFLLLIA